jgi:hypothetical protein
MFFYNDEKNLGAAKATVYTDGGMVIYLYDEKVSTWLKKYRHFLKSINLICLNLLYV